MPITLSTSCAGYPLNVTMIGFGISNYIFPFDIQVSASTYFSETSIQPSQGRNDP
jgi:hypothetical protein